MATTPIKQSVYSNCFPQNKRRLLLILLIATAAFFAATSISKVYIKLSWLYQDLMESRLFLTQYKDYIDSRLNNHAEIRLPRLEQDWTEGKARIHYLEEQIKNLNQQLLASQDGRGAIKELEAQRIQFQQKMQAYEQQMFALTEELRNYREQNQLIQQEQMRMKSEYQELLSKLNQESPSEIGVLKENLDQLLESRLSQFVNADYEHEQKFKDLQKSIENCAKVGELKALEVYYDDRLDSLNNFFQNSQKTLPGKEKAGSENPQQLHQLKQEIMKLDMEKEEMRAVINGLLSQQRMNEERLKLIEIQRNTIMNDQSVSGEKSEFPQRTKHHYHPNQASQQAKREPNEFVHDNQRKPSDVLEQQGRINPKRSPGRKITLEPIFDPHFGFMNHAPLINHLNYGPRNHRSNFPRQHQMRDLMFW